MGAVESHLAHVLWVTAMSGLVSPTPRNSPARPGVSRTVPVRRVTIDFIDRLKSRARGPNVAPESALAVPRRWQLAAFAIVMVVAILIRFVSLGTVPLGIQGDEATAALEGRRILDTGWIGVYATSAAGSPTGSHYATALSMKILGHDIFAIRAAAAFLGSVTVLALLVVLRRNLGVYSAIAGGLLLATSGWHVIFSRIAFTTIPWPLAVIIAIGALLEAIRRESWRWWGVAGAAMAVGLYAYNGHLLYLGVIGLFIAYRLFGVDGVVALGVSGLLVLMPSPLTVWVAILAGIVLVARDPRRFGIRLRFALAFVVAFSIVALPMAQYALDPAHDYFGYGRRLSVFNGAEWEARSGTTERAGFITDRYLDYYDRLCCDHRFDSVDTTGIAPVVPLPALVLAALGVALALWRRRGPLVTLGVMTLVLSPVASVTTVDYGLRRSMVIVLFLAMFGGIALVETVRAASRFRWIPRLGMISLVAILFAGTVYRNVDDYVNVTLASPLTHWVMATDMVEASEYMATLDDDAYVYFYANRWTINYEIRRYLAPDVQGVDRSTQFGEFGFDVDPARGSPVFVFVGSYRQNADIVERLYPGGQYVYGRTLPHGNGEPSFIAYVTAPPGSPVTPPSPGATPGATPVSSPLPR